MSRLYILRITLLPVSRVPLSLCPILGIAWRLFVAPSLLPINRYVTRCQLRTAVSVTVINPACLPRSCVIVPANRNSARAHIEQDNTSRHGTPRLCKYAEVEGSIPGESSVKPSVTGSVKIFQIFLKKISWDGHFFGWSGDTRAWTRHSFSRIFNIFRRPLSIGLLHNAGIGVIILKVRTG